MQIWELHFLSPIFIYLIPIIIILFLGFEYFLFRKKDVKLNIWNDLKKSWFNNYFYYFRLFLIICIFVIFSIILANPNKANIEKHIKKNWIDIVLALDISKSMEAVDLKPNRIEKAKESISKFIEKQKTNRVWLVVFAWKPISSVPLTFDYNILVENLKNLTTDSLNQNIRWLSWTAIWDALLMSKNLFNQNKDSNKNKDKKAKQNREKVIILLTDWDANVWVDPVVASKLLSEEKIRVFTIWIWSLKWWTIKVNNWFFQQTAKIPPLNSTALKKIAKNTNWYFFRATDNNSIDKIFNKLDELEKNDIEVNVTKNMENYYEIFINILIILIWILLFLEIRKVKN